MWAGTYMHITVTRYICALTNSKQQMLWFRKYYIIRESRFQFQEGRCYQLKETVLVS